jgi:hypothetical protein
MPNIDAYNYIELYQFQIIISVDMSVSLWPRASYYINIIELKKKTIHSTNANSLTNTSKSYIDQEINKKKIKK